MNACMGGWCASRAACAHYHAEGQEPAERLCPKGKEWPQPIMGEVECPYCRGPHTLSQCEKWRIPAKVAA